MAVASVRQVLRPFRVKDNPFAIGLFAADCAMYAICTAVAAAHVWWWVRFLAGTAAGVLLALVGISFSLWSATSQSMLQLTAPDALRGRIVSLYLLVFAGLSPIGSLLSGWLADVGGTRLAFLVAGVAVSVTAVYGVVRIRGFQAEPRGRPTEYVEPPV